MPRCRRRSAGTRVRRRLQLMRHAARGTATGPTAPPGLQFQVAIGTALAQLDGRTAALTATVQSVVGVFNIVSVQVGDLISVVGGLQNATCSQHSGSSASAGAADASTGAAVSLERDSLGWLVEGMRATASVFGMTPDRHGSGGDGGFGGLVPGGPISGALAIFGVDGRCTTKRTS